MNAATGEMVDLVKAGIIDPAKVTRAALQNAASIAALVLTTECLVVDKPEKKPAMPAGGWRNGRRNARNGNDVRPWALHRHPPTSGLGARAIAAGAVRFRRR